ncbi:MAG: ABC transporter ATP-binding protein [Dermatophilaceae bacterium]
MSGVTGRDMDTLPSAGRVLTVRGLSVAARENGLVEDVELRVCRGERVGLIGESGSGKTLTALAVMGLLPDGLRATGDVRLAGAGSNLLDLDERALSRLRGQQMAMVFQEPMTALNPTMRVGRQVAETMLLHGRHDRFGVREAVVTLLDDVRLPDPAGAARSYPHQLSGGQRQRVVLAMALANDPALLICDEPTTALDVTVQANVLDLIVRGVESRDAGLLFISHDLAVVATVCEQVAVMHRGRIVERGPVRQVMTDPQHPYTRRLLAAADLRDVDERGRLRRRVEAGDAVTEGTTAGESTAGEATAGGTTAGVSTARESTAGEARRSRAFAGGRPRRRPATHHVPLSAPAGAPTPAVRIIGATKEYARPRTSLFAAAPVVHALRGVDLVVAPGERVGIVGESGCGKSTLLRLVAGLEPPTSGTVQVAGRTVSGVPERRLGFLRERLQMVFQDPMGSLDPRMRIYASVLEPLLATGGAVRRERVAELLASVGIDPASASRYPHQFSGGQRQRISIARSIGPDPDILLADEPVSALDVSVRAQVLNLIADLVDGLGLTLLFVSHDLSVVRHVCERVVVMKAGRIVESGPVEQIYTDPQEPYTRRLVASIPTIQRALAGVSAADLAAAREKEHPVSS